jgi:hypothetical protein
VRVGGDETAGGVAERLPEPEPHRPSEERRSEASGRAREVAVGRIAVSGHEARADCDVAGVRLDQEEQATQLGRGMLPVGVDPTAEGIAALVGLAIAGRDTGAQASVDAERDDSRTSLTGDVGRSVRRAVVDHQHVRLRQLSTQVVEDSGEVRFLVPGGDEDDGLGLGHAARLAAAHGSGYA